MGCVGDRPWRQRCGEEETENCRRKDQEKRMYSVVESQSCDTSSIRAHTQSRDERECVPGGMEDRDWRIETRLRE